MLKGVVDLEVNYKYCIGQKVFYPWHTCYIGMNCTLQVNEGEIQAMTIRKNSHGEIVKTVDFKGRNGIPEDHVSTNIEDVQRVIDEDTTKYR
jgi:hypothetical protein